MERAQLSIGVLFTAIALSGCASTDGIYRYNKEMFRYNNLAGAQETVPDQTRAIIAMPAAPVVDTARRASGSAVKGVNG